MRSLCRRTAPREQIYTLFNNRLVEPQKDKYKMNLEDIRKHPSFKDCKSEEEVIAQAQAYAQEAGRAGSLAEENASLKARVQELRTRRQLMRKRHGKPC